MEKKRRRAHSEQYHSIYFIGGDSTVTEGRELTCRAAVVAERFRVLGLCPALLVCVLVNKAVSVGQNVSVFRKFGTIQTPQSTKIIFSNHPKARKEDGITKTLNSKQNV